MLVLFTSRPMVKILNLQGLFPIRLCFSVGGSIFIPICPGQSKSKLGQISLNSLATGPYFVVFIIDLCSIHRSCNFLLVSPTYISLQFENFIAYTTPSDWQLRFSLIGTAVFLVHEMLFVYLYEGRSYIQLFYIWKICHLVAGLVFLGKQEHNLCVKGIQKESCKLLV